MEINKKAQNITKPYTILLVIIIIAIFSIMTFRFGADVASTPGNKLNNESQLYIYERSGFTPGELKTVNDTGDLFFSSDLNSSGSTLDFALEFQFYREQSSSWRTVMQDVWNAPAYFVGGLGLDLDDWTIVLNLINTIIWAIIFYIIYRLIRGIL